LAAAQQLTRVGHTVAVFERAEEPGGLLRFGIPEFKMEKYVLDRRIRQMKDEGTNFRCGLTVGATPSWDELKERYDAVVVAIGSTVGRDLPVPGRDLNGIHQAMEYLPQSNRVVRGKVVPDQITAAGKHVVIIGGGDTGADCLGTAIRQGAKTVTQLEILPTPPEERPDTQPWPTYPMIYRVSSAHEEAGERVYSVSTSEFLGADGQVSSLRMSEVRFEGGKLIPVEGTEREIEAELVLLAMGFVGPEKDTLVEQLGVAIDERGNVARDNEYMTNVPGVFSCGDAGRGQSLIVWAISEGRACAAGVDAYLAGSTKLPRPIAPTARQMMV
jgi:glutamate synthase (NADPH/NADH) small chain